MISIIQGAPDQIHQVAAKLSDLLLPIEAQLRDEFSEVAHPDWSVFREKKTVAFRKVLELAPNNRDSSELLKALLEIDEELITFDPLREEQADAQRRDEFFKVISEWLGGPPGTKPSQPTHVTPCEAAKAGGLTKELFSIDLEIRSASEKGVHPDDQYLAKLKAFAYRSTLEKFAPNLNAEKLVSRLALVDTDCMATFPGEEEQMEAHRRAEYVELISEWLSRR